LREDGYRSVAAGAKLQDYYYEEPDSAGILVTNTCGRLKP
jgi:hypothetical protein